MPQQRLNIDDTPMGFVSDTATIDSVVFVDFEARVEDHATVLNASRIEGLGVASGYARINSARIADSAIVSGHVHMFAGSCVSEDVRLWGNATIGSGARIFGNAHIGGTVSIPSEAEVGYFAWIMSPYHYCGGKVGIYPWDAYLSWNPKKPGYFINVHFGCQTMPLGCWDDAKRMYWAPKCDQTAIALNKSNPAYWHDALDMVMDYAEKAIIKPDAPPDFELAPKR